MNFESDFFKVSSEQVNNLKTKYCDNCSICKGQRFVIVDNKRQKCECVQKFNEEYKLIASNIPVAFRDATSKDIDKGFIQQNSDAMKIVAEYSKKIPKALEKGLGLYLQGVNGAGKCVKFDMTVVDPETGELCTVEELYKKGKTTVLGLKNDFKLSSYTTSSIVNNGIKPCYEVVTKYGRKISITNNHPLLTLDGWKQLKDLKVGDNIAVPSTLFVKGKELITDAEIRLLGFLIGDGCTTDQCSFTNITPKVICQFKKDVKTLSNKLEVHVRNKKCFYIVQPTLPPGKATLIKEFIKKHELLGKHAWEKTVPKVVFKSTKRQIALFINSLFACGGCVYNRSSKKKYSQICIEYNSTSEQLIYDIQHLLLRFGINGLIYEHKAHYKVNGKKKLCRINYRLTINNAKDVNTFINKIGILGKTNNKMFRKADKSNQQFTLPLKIWEKIKNVLMNLKNIPSNFRKSCYIPFRSKFRPSLETAKEIGKIFKNSELISLGSSDILWHPIKSITFIGKHQTYDLSVPKVHNFVCNDIIVHNSFFATLILKRVLREGFSGYFILLKDLINASFDSLSNNDIRNDLEKLITETDFLIIDELDKVFNDKNDVVRNLLEDLFKRR